MKLIPLTNHYEFVYVDDEDYEDLIKYKWRMTGGYAVKTIPWSSSAPIEEE